MVSLPQSMTGSTISIKPEHHENFTVGNYYGSSGIAGQNFKLSPSKISSKVAAIHSSIEFSGDQHSDASPRNLGMKMSVMRTESGGIMDQFAFGSQGM